MRVGVSLLTDAPPDLGGSETSARQLLGALAAVGTLEYAVIVPRGAKDVPESLPAIEIDHPRVDRPDLWRIPAAALASRRAVGIGTRLAALDVVHYPLTMPVSGVDAPTVVTLHDVQHRNLPEFFGPVERSARREAFDRAARGAAAVVVTSEFVRRRAIEVLELDPSRVHVVHLGVDHAVFRPGAGEREPFLVYPARPWPHKNHVRLLEAFSTLRETRPQLRLVLVGEGLERLDPLPEGVERVGVASPSRLASLYRRAACLVFPSLDEGFGLPPLEAMACGCPVAASSAGAIPEVCGEAAVLFDPADVEAMASAILETDTRRDELREKGLARAAHFTWEDAARKHDALYLEAAGTGAATPK